MLETDRRYQEQNSLNPGFLLAVLLWLPLEKTLVESTEKRFHLALRHAVEQVLEKQGEILTIPHRLSAMMRSIWLLQFYLIKPRKKRVYRTLFHRYFRAAFDFLALRVKSGDPHQNILDWWTRFREADANIRQQMLNEMD